jgi:hypothetical protein
MDDGFDRHHLATRLFFSSTIRNRKLVVSECLIARHEPAGVEPPEIRTLHDARTLSFRPEMKHGGQAAGSEHRAWLMWLFFSIEDRKSYVENSNASSCSDA